MRGRAMPVQTVEVGEAAGQRLDNFLIGRLKGVPRSRIYRMVRGGEVRVNGGRAKASQRLSATDRVRIPPYKGTDAAEALVDGGRVAAAVLDGLIHEDDDLIVVDKPSGIAVHGGSGVRAGLIETLRARKPKGWLELAHRIDRDTSGVLVLAKNRRTLLAWHEAFRKGRVRKRYDAIVDGEWPATLRTVRSPLKRLTLAGGERRMRVASDGQFARTDFEVVARGEHTTHLRAFPKTGRTTRFASTQPPAATPSWATTSTPPARPEAADSFSMQAACAWSWTAPRWTSMPRCRRRLGASRAPRREWRRSNGT